MFPSVVLPAACKTGSVGNVGVLFICIKRIRVFLHYPKVAHLFKVVSLCNLLLYKTRFYIVFNLITINTNFTVFVFFGGGGGKHPSQFF